MVRDYWRPSSATLELGWGPEAEGDLAQLKLSMVDSPCGYWTAGRYYP